MRQRHCDPAEPSCQQIGEVFVYPATRELKLLVPPVNGVNVCVVVSVGYQGAQAPPQNTINRMYLCKHYS